MKVLSTGCAKQTRAPGSAAIRARSSCCAEPARYFTDNIKVGIVGVNVALPMPVACHSFGGWRRSLFGDLCAYGPDAVRFYTRRKTITQRWLSGGVREQAKYTFPSTT